VKTLLYENETVDEFCDQLSRARTFDFAFGLLSHNGLSELKDDLIKCLKGGGYGRVLVGADMPTHPEAIRWLRKLEAEYKDHLVLRRFQSGKGHMFHVKLAIFESRTGKQTAILGSSNLTGGGLLGNYEANLLLDSRPIVGELLDYFEEQFAGAYARRIDDIWFDNYLKWWKERARAERRLRQIRERIRKLPAKRTLPKTLPKRIKGSVLAFTGKIDGWPREARLYPTIRRFGGRIVLKADSIKSADCLVHGQILLRNQTTKKLGGARRYNIPTITEDEFFDILANEKRLRR
jgi:HKD family nuclease